MKPPGLAPSSRALPAPRLAAVLAGLLALAYPFLAHWGMERLGQRLFGLLVALVFLARALSTRRAAGDDQPATLPLSLAASVALAATAGAFVRDPRALLFLPAVISLCFLASLGQGLLRPPTFIERLAQRDFPVLPPSAVRHCRGVTRIWCLFLGANAATIAALALWAPRAWWTWYSGLFSYVLMGLLLGGEYLVRRHREPVFQAELRVMQAGGVGAPT